MWRHDQRIEIEAQPKKDEEDVQQQIIRKMKIERKKNYNDFASDIILSLLKFKHNQWTQNRKNENISLVHSFINPYNIYKNVEEYDGTI